MGFNYPQGKSGVLQEQLWLSQHVPLCFSPHSFLTPAHHRFPGTSSSVTCWLGKLERLSNSFLTSRVHVDYLYHRMIWQVFSGNLYLPFHSSAKGWWAGPTYSTYEVGFPQNRNRGRNLRFKAPSLLIKLFIKLSIHFQIWKELQDAETNSF